MQIRIIELLYVTTVISDNAFFSPCLSLIKLEKYYFGKWYQMMNNVNYFIFYEEKMLTHLMKSCFTLES